MNKETLIRIFRQASADTQKHFAEMIRSGYSGIKLSDPPLSLREFSKTCPEPILSEERELKNGLWVPKHPGEFTFGALEWGYASAISYPLDIQQVPPPPKPEPKSEPFEVNLTECLIGWRCWEYDVTPEVVLTSISHTGSWEPGKPITADCDEKTCAESPTTFCSCGIYAVDERTAVPGGYPSEYIKGQVYGWGRYVRGENGWRSQYAYPASFYLHQDQAFLAQPLRLFRVPIYIDQPIQCYSPAEDGYEHGQDITDGDSGAVEDSDTTQED